MKKVVNILGITVFTGCLVFGFLYFWSDILKPDLEEERINYSEEVIDYTEKLRDFNFTDNDLFKIQRMSTTVTENSLPGWIFLAPVLWTLIYDTLYAMADKDEDLKIEVKSTAILLAKYDQIFITLL